MVTLKFDVEHKQSIEVLGSIEETFRSQILSLNTKLVLNFNDKIAKTVSGQTISLYVIDNSLKAELFIENQVQASEIKVIIVGNPKINESGSLVGSNLGAEFDKIKKTIYIGKVKGLNGGSNENYEIEGFKEILSRVSENKNPFVNTDIKSFLVTFVENDEIDLNTYESLPEDFIICIEKVITSLKKKNIDKNPAIKENIKKNIMDSMQVFEYWGLFNILLEMNCFKKLRIKESKKIIDFFLKNANADDIVELLDSDNRDELIIEEFHLKENEIKEKLPELKDDELEDWNIETIISQIIDTRPKTNMGLISLIGGGKKKKYFKGKSLVYRDASSYKIILQSYIESFNKTNGIDIGFSNNAKLTITKVQNDYNVHLEYSRDIGLAKYLIEKEVNSHFSITIVKGLDICKGKYKGTVDSNTHSKWFDSIKAVFKKNNLNIYTLVNEDHEYLIEALLQSKKSVYKIILKEKKNGRFSEIKTYQSIEEFDNENKLLNLKKVEKIIPVENIDDYIIIEELENLNQRKNEQLKIIQDKCSNLRDSLKKEQTIRNYIITCLFKNNLESLPDDIFEQINSKYPGFNIEKDINEISSLYLDELETVQDPKSILLKATKDVNYEELVKKKESLKTQEIVKLLVDSKSHLDNMVDKELIIILGSTGSGKSTTSCYLLKAPLIKADSRFGEKTIILEEKKVKGHLEQYPKIGQSIGTSETLYAQGYELKLSNKKTGIMLCDCPGFHDTRGSEYRLCTNFSIDRTIKQAKSINAIILTIPYHAFLIERGNSALLAFKDLIDLVPGFLEGGAILDSIFIMITKADNINNAKNSFKDRINQHIIEINATIESNLKSNIEEFFQKEMNDKKNIWMKIADLNLKKHIFFVNVKETKERNTILKLLEKCKPIEKRLFNTDLFTSDMKTEFSSIFESSTHTWTKVIFSSLICVIPNEIKKLNDEIDYIKNQIELKSKEKEKCIEAIKQIKTNKIEYQNKINEMEVYKKKIDNQEINYDEVVEFMAKENINKEENTHKEREKLKNGIEEKNLSIKGINEKISNSNEEKTKINSIIEEKTEKKHKLEHGWVKETLLNFPKLNPDDQLNIDLESSDCYWFRKLVGKYLGNIFVKNQFYNGPAKGFIGKMHHYSKITKDYRILHVNDENYLSSDKLEGNFLYPNTNNNKIDKTASIIGEHFKIDFKNSMFSNNIWTVTTIWEPNNIPYFELNDLKKSSEVHEATIDNLNNEIKQEEEKLSGVKEVIERDNSNLNEENKNLESLTQSLEAHEAEALKCSSTNMENLINDYNKTIQDEKIVKKNYLEIIQNCECSINKHKDSIKNIEENIKNLMLKSALFALIIKDESNNLECLFKLCYTLQDFIRKCLKQKALHEFENFMSYSSEIDNLKIKMEEELERHKRVVSEESSN